MNTSKATDPKNTYTISFLIGYMKGVRSKRFNKAKGTVQMETPHTLDELRNAPPDSPISKGVVKLIHNDCKNKVPGPITSVEVKDIQPTLTIAK